MKEENEDKICLSSRMGLLWSIWLGAGGCTSAHHPNGKTALNYQQRLQPGLKIDKRKQIEENSPSLQLQLIIRGRNSWLQDVTVPGGSCCSVKGLVMLNPTVTHTVHLQGLCCWWGSPALSLKAPPVPFRDGYGQKHPKHNAVTSHRHCFIYRGLSHRHCFIYRGLSSLSLYWDGQSFRKLLGLLPGVVVPVRGQELLLNFPAFDLRDRKAVWSARVGYFYDTKFFH